MGWTLWRGAETKIVMNEAAIDALFVVGAEIGQAADKEVPLRDEDLRLSLRITKSRSKMRAAVNIAYGNRKTPYAVRWHESARIKGKGGKWVTARFRHGRKLRYLADPFNRIAPARVHVEYIRALQRAFNRHAFKRVP